MVYKGVIFIHFPCMKIAAGWHRIIIPKALLVLAEHTLTSAACGSAVVWRLDTASRCVIPGIASLIPCFHCLYPTLSDSIPPVKVHHFMIISPCVGFYPNFSLVSTIITASRTCRHTPFLSSQGTSTNSMGGFPAMKLMTQEGIISHYDYIVSHSTSINSILISHSTSINSHWYPKESL